MISMLIKLPQMTCYIRKFEGNTTMSFKISDKQFSKKYNQIQKRVEKLSKIEFDSDSKPVYGDDDKYIKTTVKIYHDGMITNFQSKTMSKKKAPCKCLSIIMLDSVIKAKKSHQTPNTKKSLSSNNLGRM